MQYIDVDIVFPENYHKATIETSTVICKFQNFNCKKCTIKIYLPFFRFMPNFFMKIIPVKILNIWSSKCLGCCINSSSNMLEKMYNTDSKNFEQLIRSYKIEDLCEDIENRSLALSHIFERNTYFVLFSLLIDNIFNITLNYFNVSQYIIALINIVAVFIIIFTDNFSLHYDDKNSIETICKNKFIVEKYYESDIIPKLKNNGCYLIGFIEKTKRIGHCIAATVKNEEIYVYDSNSGLHKGKIDEIIYSLSDAYFKTRNIKILTYKIKFKTTYGSIN